MKKKIFLLLWLFFAFQVTHAIATNESQSAVTDREKTVTDPEEMEPDTYIPPVENYPNFTVEFLGVDYLYDLEKVKEDVLHRMKKFDWGNLLHGNAAFLYAIRLHQSRFAFCFGVGWSNLQYAFPSKEDTSGEVTYATLKKVSENKTECVEKNSRKGKKISYSRFEIPYIDLLARIRYNSVLDDPKQGFHGWLGFKLGFRRRAATTIGYREYDDPSASESHKGYFDTRLCAIGVQLGIGYYRFGLTGGLQLTPLFVKDKGPKDSNGLKPFSFGVYLDLL